MSFWRRCSLGLKSVLVLWGFGLAVLASIKLALYIGG